MPYKHKLNKISFSLAINFILLENVITENDLYFKRCMIIS